MPLRRVQAQLYRNLWRVKVLGPTQPPTQWVPGPSRGVKRAGRGADHPPPYTAVVEERVELYFYSLSGPSWPVLGWPLPLPYRARKYGLSRKEHNIPWVCFVEFQGRRNDLVHTPLNTSLACVTLFSLPPRRHSPKHAVVCLTVSTISYKSWGLLSARDKQLASGKCICTAAGTCCQSVCLQTGTSLGLWQSAKHRAHCTEMTKQKTKNLTCVTSLCKGSTRPQRCQ